MPATKTIFQKAMGTSSATCADHIVVVPPSHKAGGMTDQLILCFVLLHHLNAICLHCAHDIYYI